MNPNETPLATPEAATPAPQVVASPPSKAPMKHRNVIAVALLLPIITFGIYSLYWMVSTKLELNRRGSNIPTAWILIIPIVNIWWMWKYSEAVEEQFGNKLSAPISFILLFLLGSIGGAIIQNTYNKESK